MTQWVRVLAPALIAGYVATTAKTKAEAFLQPQAERLWPPSESEKLLPGADPSDHPENMPPAEIVSRVAGAMGRSLDDDTQMKDAAVLHWGMGVGFSIGYALVARRMPTVRVGWGAPAGLALYAATHASTLPAADLQPAPWRMPRAALAWEAGSHVVYGVVLDRVLRIGQVLFRSSTA